MNRAQPSPAKRAAIGAAVGLVVGPVLGFLLVMVVSAFSPELGPVALFGTVVAAPVVGAVLGHRSATAAHRAAAAGEAERRADHAAHERDRLARELERARDALATNAIAGAREFANLGTFASSACDHAEKAAKYYELHAFSPFWSEIEDAYVALGNYLKALDSVSWCAANHPRVLDRFRSNGGTGDVAAFPVDLDAASAAATAEAIADALQPMVFEAQRDPVFAQIWEQRRTTAAVVSGFRNLEHAVAEVGRAVGENTARLVAAVEEGNRSTSRLVLGQGEVASTVRDAVRFLDDQRNRALGITTWRVPPPVP